MPVDIRKPLKKLLPHLLQAKSDNLNEADTVLRLIKVFEDVLGYDGMSEISREAQMKNKYVDVVLKIDGVVKLLVEAKAAGETLRDRHIEQAQAYAAQNNYRWVLLTNGVVWNLYHLTFEEGIEFSRAFSVDLSEAAAIDQSANTLAVLHKLSIKKGELEDFWEKSTALRPDSIGRALFQEDILAGIRREVRRESGLLIDQEDLAAAIHDMLSAEARELIGPLRIRKRRGAAKKIAVATAEEVSPPSSEEETAEPPASAPSPAPEDAALPKASAGDAPTS